MTRSVAPSAVSGMNSTMCRATSARNSCHARRRCAFFAASGSCAVADQPPHGAAAVAAPAQHVEQHPVRHLEARHELLGRRADQPLERVEVPVDEVVLGRLALDDLLAVAGRLLAQADVLDHVLRRLHDHVAAVVEALAAGAAGDLVEVARREERRLPAVELAQPREEHGADRHVDAGAERVGAADDLEQAELRELLDQHAVLRQQARVVQADAVPQPLADVGAVRAREVEVGDARRDRLLLLARVQIFRLVKSCALPAASACVKWTT